MAADKIIFASDYLIKHIIDFLPLDIQCQVARVSQRWYGIVMTRAYNRPFSEQEFYAACREGDTFYLSSRTWPIQWLVYGFRDANRGHQEAVVRRFLRLLSEPREDGVPINMRGQLVKWRKYVGMFDNDKFKLSQEIYDIINKYLCHHNKHNLVSIIAQDNIGLFKKLYPSLNHENFMNYDNSFNYTVECMFKYGSLKILQYVMNKYPNETMSYGISGKRMCNKAFTFMKDIVDKGGNMRIADVAWRWIMPKIATLDYEIVYEYLFLKDGSNDEYRYNLLEDHIMDMVRGRFPYISAKLQPFINPLLPINDQHIRYMGIYDRSSINRYINNDQSDIKSLINGAIDHCPDFKSIKYAWDIFVKEYHKDIGHVFSQRGISVFITHNNLLNYTDTYKILKLVSEFVIKNEDQNVFMNNILWSMEGMKYDSIYGSMNEYVTFVDYIIKLMLAMNATEKIWRNNILSTLLYDNNNHIALRLLKAMPDIVDIDDFLKELLDYACKKDNYEILRYVKNKINNTDIRCRSCQRKSINHFHMVQL